MDWLRRNWPDMLIGIALLAVIAGIVATLLTGGSFFPLDPGQGATPTTSSPSVVAPASPGSESPVANPPGSETPGAGSPDAGTPDASDGASPSAQPQVDVVTPGGAAADEGQVAAPGTPSQASAADDEEPSTPRTPAGGNPGAIAVLPPANSAAAAANADQGDGGAAAADADAAAAPPTPAAASDAPTAPFRVSVGAFGSVANAERQAETFRSAGFPVFLGRQGDLVLVLVGPYDTEQEAQQAVTRIRSGGFGIEPVVYRFQPDDASAGPGVPQDGAAPAAEEPADAPAAGEASQPAPDAPVDAAPSDAAASDLQVATSGGMYLQVGAYATRDSARPQMERLQGMGFEVAEREESGLVKLLVGPYDGADLSAAQAQLNDAGIEHFARQ